MVSTPHPLGKKQILSSSSTLTMMQAVKNMRLIAWTAALVILGALFFMTQRDKPSRRGDDALPGMPVFNGKAKDAAAITIKIRDRKPYVIQQRNGTWVFKQGFATDKDQLEEFFKAFERISWSSSFAIDQSHPLSEYGLSEPGEWYEVTWKDGSRQKLYIGGKSPAAGNQFVRMEKGPRALVVSEGELLLLQKTDQQLRDKTILEIKEKDLTGFRLLNAKGRKTVWKRSSLPGIAWVDDQNRPLNKTEMEMFTAAFDPLKALSFPSGAPSPKGLVREVTLLTRQGGSHTLQVWKDGDKNLLKVKGKSQVYYMSEDTIYISLAKSMLEQRLIPWFQDEMVTLTFTTPSGEIKARRNEETAKWVCEGAGLKPACGDELTTLLDTLSSASAFAMVKSRKNAPDNTLYTLSIRLKLENQPVNVTWTFGMKGNLMVGTQDLFGVSFKTEDYIPNRLRVFQRQVFEKPNL